MLIGLCASALSAQDALAASPIDYLEENVQSFLEPEGTEEAFGGRRASAGRAGKPVVAANCFLPGALKCVGPQVDGARLAAYADHAFRRARAAGIDTIVFGSGGARQVPDAVTQAQAQAQFVALLRSLGPIAERHGVTIAVEPLNRGVCYLINTLGEVAEAVRQAGHPRVRLLADLFHMLRNDETAESIGAVGPLLVHAHIAERETRSAPGVQGDDFRRVRGVLRRAGYDRRLSFECGWGDLARELPAAVTALRAQLTDAGYTGQQP
jgi:sugar phosphate isomerase/epimerase